MESLKLCESDYRFMSVVWEYEPLTSKRLVILCAKELGWKKPTTNNVLRKLCEKGLVRNTGAVVKSLIPKEKVQFSQNEHFVKRAFTDSLPVFLSSFLDAKVIPDYKAGELSK
jgi:BlaI family penicillinase repressor